MNNLEVKFTLRLYEPSLIAELIRQCEKAQNSFKSKNEFFTHIINLGLKADRQNQKIDVDKKFEDAFLDKICLILFET